MLTDWFLSHIDCPVQPCPSFSYLTAGLLWYALPLALAMTCRLLHGHGSDCGLIDLIGVVVLAFPFAASAACCPGLISYWFLPTGPAVAGP